jgi:hypothetical protein
LIKIKLAGLLGMLFLCLSCGKQGVYIPEVPVNYNITVQQFSIQSENGILKVPDQGVAGLLIVRTATGYMAYDRCSPVNPEALCQITPDEGGITVTDPCSGGKWLLLDGSPQKAPAVHYLKTYTLRIQGGQNIQVTN